MFNSQQILLHAFLQSSRFSFVDDIDGSLNSCSLDWVEWINSIRDMLRGVKESQNWQCSIHRKDFAPLHVSSEKDNMVLDRAFVQLDPKIHYFAEKKDSS